MEEKDLDKINFSLDSPNIFLKYLKSAQYILETKSRICMVDVVDVQKMNFDYIVISMKDDYIHVECDRFGHKCIYYDKLLSHLSTDVNDLLSLRLEQGLSLSLDSEVFLECVFSGGNSRGSHLVKDIYRIGYGRSARISVAAGSIEFVENNLIGSSKFTHDLGVMTSLFNQGIDELANSFEGDFLDINLSGGLDSKTVYLQSINRINKSSIVATTFGTASSKDIKIAKRLINSEGGEFYFSNSGVWDDNLLLKSMLDIDFSLVAEPLSLSYGSKGKALLTGQLGDVVVGTYLKEVSSLQKEKYLSLYGKNRGIVEMSEQDLFMKRGIRLINIGLTVLNRVKPTYSPFLFVPFFEYCMSLPQSARSGHKLYLKWLKYLGGKHLLYKWDKMNASVKGCFILFDRVLSLPYFFRVIVSRLKSLVTSNIKTPKHSDIDNAIVLRGLIDENSIQLLNSYKNESFSNYTIQYLFALKRQF